MASSVGVKVLVLSFFLCGSLCAETSARLDSIRYQVYEALNVSTSGTDIVTVARVNRKINTCIMEVCGDFPAVEKLDTIIACRDSVGFTLNTDFLRVRGVFKKTALHSLIPLTPIEIDVAFDKMGAAKLAFRQSNLDTLTPRYYLTHAKKLMFEPKVGKFCTDADTFLVAYFAHGRYLNTDTAQTDILPEYRDELLDLVCARVSMDRGDVKRAQEFFALYNNRKPPVDRAAELKK